MGFFKKSVLGFGFTLVFINPTACGDSARLEAWQSSTDKNLLTKFEGLEPGSHVALISQGGDPDWAQAIANVIRDKDIELTIFEFCASSCAEYLLPATPSLHFKNSPVIGFHQTPVMIEHFRTFQDDKMAMPTCHYGDNAADYQNFTSAPEAWRETLVRLEVDRIELQSKPDCVEVAFSFRRQLWLPTSQQLRDIWRLKFDGDVCADNYEACAKRLRKFMPKGQTVVVGDQDFIID